MKCFLCPYTQNHPRSVMLHGCFLLSICNVVSKRRGLLLLDACKHCLNVSVIDESFQPSFPCDAEIKLSKDSFWTPIKLHEIEENTIRYNIKEKTYTKSLDNIYEIRFYISNSIEEYNFKMYYYGKEGVTISL